MADGFDARLILQGLAGGGENIANGITDMIKKQKQSDAEMAGSMIHFNTLRQAGLLSPEEITDFNNGNSNKRNAIVMAAVPRLAEKFQTDKERQQAEQHRLNRELQLQIANMHYGPDGSSQSMFKPDDATSQAMQAAGYTFAPTSNKAGRWINTQGNKPDLDENGNPVFSPDGSAYLSGGKVRPLTPTMDAARKDWLKKQEDAKAAAGPHWYDRFIPDALKSKAAPTPTPSIEAVAPAAQLSTQDQQALAWAQANASDPRAAAILKKLGVQ